MFHVYCSDLQAQTVSDVRTACCDGVTRAESWLSCWINLLFGGSSFLPTSAGLWFTSSRKLVPLVVANSISIRIPCCKEGLDLTWSLEDARSTCMGSNLSVRKGDPQHRWRWSFREGHYRQACKPQWDKISKRNLQKINHMYGTSCATSAAGDDITETQVAIRWPTGIPLIT